MKRAIYSVIIIFLILFVIEAKALVPVTKYDIIVKYTGMTPKLWSESVPGVIRSSLTHKKIIALTFDACGGKTDGFDKKLIGFLKHNDIPVTLFINMRWIDKFHEIFNKLASDPLFEIENHGLLHRPLSVNGRLAYGIKGTENVSAVFDEVELASQKIRSLTGKRPKFFRSGTAYYDEVAAKIVNELGYRIAGFSVNGDGGASFNKEQIIKTFLSAKPGAIIICHMNHPERHTAEGVIAAIPLLRKKGFKFVKLEDLPGL